MVREVIRELLVFLVLLLGFLFFLYVFILQVGGLIANSDTSGCSEWGCVLTLGAVAGGFAYLLYKYLW